MNDETTRAATWTQGRPFFLGHALAAYATSEELDDAGLAARLGVAESELAALRLCRVPDTEPVAFRLDVEAICERFGIAPGVLAAAVRHAQTLAAVSGTGRMTEAGRVMAARDADEE